MVERFLREERKEQRAKGIAPAKASRKTKPPEELAYLLEWYRHIRRGQSRGQEYEPISHVEILAFRALHHLEDEMLSFDVVILGRLDGVWQANLPKPAEKPDRPPVGRG